jgi:hypothetical protein
MVEDDVLRTSGYPFGSRRSSGMIDVFFVSETSGDGSDGDGSAVYSVKARLVCFGLDPSTEVDASDP